ncbi:MAG: insulinase family protein [Melioribacteraceae bacterium]|nr:insulinase family protein [Melioribacteraceae bacterium]
MLSFSYICTAILGDKVREENYNITRLANGTRVVTEQIPFIDSFSLGFWIDTGSKNENKTTNGLSHFVEHMLFKGTKRRTSKQISEDVESLGGYLNAFTSKEHTCYYGRGMKRHLPEIYDVLSDMLQNSTFSQKEIKKEAGVIVDELNDIEDSPEEIIFEKFESNLLKGNSLHYPIIGTEKNIRSFGHKDFVNYTKRFYTPDNLCVVVSGNVEHQQVVDLVSKSLSRRVGKNHKRKKKIILSRTDDLNVSKEIQQAHVIIGRTTFGYKDKRRLKVNLLSHILGEGSSSRLFQSLREKNGITYQVNTFLNSFYDVSTFGVYLSTGEQSVKKAIKLVYNEFDKAANKKITKKEFERAKEYLKGQMIIHLENTTNRMIRMAQSILYFDRVKKIEESINDIVKIELDEIQQLASKLLIPNKFTKVVISSNNSLKQPFN